MGSSVRLGRIAGIEFGDRAATVIALVFGAGASLLAVGTAWSTGIVRVIPPLLHGYADITVTLH